MADTNLVVQSRRATIIGVIAYAVLWGASVAYLLWRGEANNADWTFPVVSLVIFGLVLPGIVWLLTIGPKPAAPTVRRPGIELVAVLAYLIVYAVGFLGFGMGALRSAIAAGQVQEIAVLVAKLAVHVVAPVILLVILRADVMSLFRGKPRAVVFWRTLLVIGMIILALLSVVSPSLKQIAGLHAAWTTLAWAAPASFIWIALEAGLCEEFLFRAVLQTRLEAVLKSPIAAICAASLLFALAHVPGLFLRGGPDVDGWSTDPVQVVAYTIATLSPIALMFGTLWVRTRSLLLCALLHASVDVLPNLAAFVQMWAK